MHAIDVLDSGVALGQMIDKNLARLGEPMAYAHGVRTEHPAEKPRVVHGIFNVAPFDSANPFAPRQNPSKNPYANIICVEANTFEEKYPVDTYSQRDHQYEHAERNANLKSRIRLSIMCRPRADA